MQAQFIETNVLLAILEDDWDKAEALVKDMTPTERRNLRIACGNVSALCS